MTTPIAAISAIGGLGSLGAVTPAAATNPNSAANFAQALGNGLDQVQATQTNADNLAVAAATGQLTDPATYTVAATQAQLMTQLMTTLESKGVEAFNQIMAMQA
jgi:flagellar hook-basal body complex protein FliE